MSRQSSSDVITKIEIPEYEQEEVFAVLEHIYTGNFTKPEPYDLISWIKFWRAAKKFEVKGMVKECLKNVPDDLIEEKMADHRLPTQSRMKQCTVCFEKLMEPLLCLIPCGHTDTCSNCIEVIQRGNETEKCPICRQAFMSVNKVYF